MAKVTGIGGVFLKCRGDSDALAAWYQKHLGMPLEVWGGAILRWPDDKAEDKGLTVWSLAGKDSQWFSPSESSFMINYRVDDLDALLAQLQAAGVALSCCSDPTNWTLADAAANADRQRPSRATESMSRYFMFRLQGV